MITYIYIIIGKIIPLIERSGRELFADIGKYEACGIFTKGHFILITITIVGILIALKQTIKKNKEEVYKIIKRVTMVMCLLETLKIIYNIKQNSIHAVNTYLPLYYCSILLYAGLLSSFGKGSLKRAGEVSLATGAVIGGIVFLIYPSTSLPIYPAFHIVSIYSFLFHGVMIYLGILLNKTKYMLIELPLNNEYKIIDDVLNEIKVNGLIPIIAHPERYSSYYGNYDFFNHLIQNGCLLQGNIGSLAGKYGKNAKKMLKNLLKRDMITVIGTDIHHSGSSILDINVEKCLKKIVKDPEKIEALMFKNAMKIIKNEKINK